MNENIEGTTMTEALPDNLHLKVRGVALWIKTLRGETPSAVDAFETLLLAADALAALEAKGAPEPVAPSPGLWLKWTAHLGWEQTSSDDPQAVHYVRAAPQVAPEPGTEPPAMHLASVIETVADLLEREGNAKLGASLLRDGLKERKRRDQVAPEPPARKTWKNWQTGDLTTDWRRVEQWKSFGFDVHEVASAPQAVPEPPDPWISIETTLPVFGRDVLVFVARTVSAPRILHRLSVDPEVWFDNDMGNWRGITHWMPLPAAPGAPQAAIGAPERDSPEWDAIYDEGYEDAKLTFSDPTARSGQGPEAAIQDRADAERYRWLRDQVDTGKSLALCEAGTHKGEFEWQPISGYCTEWTDKAMRFAEKV